MVPPASLSSVNMTVLTSGLRNWRVFFFFYVIAGEVLAGALPHIQNNIHPIVIISAFKKALEDALQIVEDISTPVDTNNTEEMMSLIKSSIGTKFVSTWSDLMCKLALDAVRCVAIEEDDTGKTEVDIKRYARVEKVCITIMILFCVSMLTISIDSRWWNWTISSFGWYHFEQRCDPSQDASSYWKPSRYSFGLSSWI